MAQNNGLYSPYMDALANPESIPRMYGETVEQALARVQAWQNELDNRVRTRAAMVDKQAPEQIDWQQTPDEMIKSLGATLSDASLGNNQQNFIASLPQATEAPQASGGAAAASGGAAQQPVFSAGPGWNPYDTSNFIASGVPDMRQIAAPATSQSRQIQNITPESQGLMGAGNADYKSELIKSLRQSSLTPFSTNQGVNVYANQGNTFSNWKPPSTTNSAFNPQVLTPRAATDQEVADWNAYSAYRTNALRGSIPVLSMAEWLAQGKGNGPDTSVVDNLFIG